MFSDVIYHISAGHSPVAEEGMLGGGRLFARVFTLLFTLAECTFNYMEVDESNRAVAAAYAIHKSAYAICLVVVSY